MHSNVNERYRTMIVIGYNDMNKMIADGNKAFHYAWDHYEELKERPAKYTLYGPRSPRLGILAAGHMTPAKERRLQKQTKRKDYTVYELDQDFQVLRIKHVKNYNQIDCTYHLFELDGVVYARPFLKDEKIFYTGRTIAVKFFDGRPLYHAVTDTHYLCVDFYEYPRPDCVHTTCYLYLPASKVTSAGQVVSWDAPIGAQNSPVTLDFCEEEYHHIDFSEYV